MNVEKTWFYSFARVIVGFIYRFIFGARITGEEHFPRDQNCILLGNHVSAWDPLTIANFYKHNEMHFMSKEPLFRIPVLRWILRKLHAFPVRRGETDMQAMRMSMQVLREGHVLGIFPEGHRQKDGKVKALETGIAVMVLKTDVPVVPVYIYGKYTFRGHVHALVGPPVPLDDLRSRRADVETMELVKSRIVEALAALEEEAG